MERLAGIPAEKIVEAHGTLHTSHCIAPDCNKEYSREWITGIDKKINILKLSFIILLLYQTCRKSTFGCCPSLWPMSVCGQTRCSILWRATSPTVSTSWRRLSSLWFTNHFRDIVSCSTVCISCWSVNNFTLRKLSFFYPPSALIEFLQDVHDCWLIEKKREMKILLWLFWDSAVAYSFTVSFVNAVTH